MVISAGDIVFTRMGEPILISARNPQTRQVQLEGDFNTVQEHSRKGLKNALSPAQRAEYRATLERAVSPDEKSEIDNLFVEIQKLEKNQADKRVIQYLKGDLAHKMIQTKYQPRFFEVDPVTLISY